MHIDFFWVGALSTSLYEQTPIMLESVSLDGNGDTNFGHVNGCKAVVRLHEFSIVQKISGFA